MDTGAVNQWRQYRFDIVSDYFEILNMTPLEVLPSPKVMPKNDRWIVATICFLCSATMFATSIVAIRTPAHVVIAADTLGRSVPDNSEGERKAISHCKIYSSGEVFFALAAFTSDIKSGFYARPIAARALHVSGPLRSDLNA